MAQYYENIASYTVGSSLPAQWVNRINAASHTVGVAAATEFGEPYMYVSAAATATDGSRVYSYAPLDNVQDVEMLVKFSIGSATASTNGRNGVAYTRYMGTSEATTKGMAGSFTLASSVKSIMVNEDSVVTAVDYSNFNWSLDTKYWLRQRISGNNYYVKIWSDGSSEPGSWTKSGSYAWPAIAAPYSGVGHYRGQNTLRVFQFSAGTSGDVAPVAQITQSQSVNARIVYPPVPSSTPIVGYGGGWAGVGGFGRAFGEALLLGATVTDRTISANARLSRVTTQTMAANARMQRFEPKTQLSNARITAQASRTQPSNARVQKTVDRTTSAVARLQTVVDRVQGANANLLSYFVATDRTQTLNASIRRTTDRTQPSSARVTQQVLRTQSATSRLQRLESRILLANARVQRTVDATQITNASIRRTVDRTIGVSAVLQYIQAQVQQANARLQKPALYTQTAQARITTASIRTVPANASLLRIPTRSQPARGLIAKEMLQVQPASAFIIRILDGEKPRTGVVTSRPSTRVPRNSANSRSASTDRPRVAVQIDRPRR